MSKKHINAANIKQYFLSANFFEKKFVFMRKCRFLKKPRVEMGTVLILNRGLGKPSMQISTATHIHSWCGRFYLVSCILEIFQVSIEM
jgi:hypothetical protein